MKLLSKTSINYLWVSVTILIVTGILLFILLFKSDSEEQREQLELQADMVTAELNAGHAINYPLVRITTNQHPDHKPVFKDTVIYDYIQKAYEGYYYLRQTKTIKGKPVTLTVMTTSIGSEGISKVIILISVVSACMLVLGGGTINYFMNKKIWNPFLLNLKQVQVYSVSTPGNLDLIPSSVDEFEELNKVITDLAERARQEYSGLKEFTENASHEIQTPLAIIKSRLESMSQFTLDPRFANYLSDTKQALNRLSKINRGLLLLAKLDNNVFPDKQEMQLDQVILTMLGQMEDLFDHRKMALHSDIREKTVHASPYLLEILITNLLSNILQHGEPNSTVSIQLSAQHMVFSNAGNPLGFPQDKLFSRFGKTVAGYKGNGLGLSIVHQICVVHHWNIVYAYSDGRHTFQIDLPSSLPA
ncbi:MAG: HAMP domain-containing sensor histidine kinase [Pedobacter sp.]|uniref:sensor histidine kinase n=1 Tax=Pedobacter sp. TaxID=1411316 RepID=UPI0033992BAA